VEPVRKGSGHDTGEEPGEDEKAADLKKNGERQDRSESSVLLHPFDAVVDRPVSTRD